MKVAIVHYSLPPIVGGVETVIQAHTNLLLEAGYEVTLIGGKGEKSVNPSGVRFVQIAKMSSLDPEIVQVSQQLEHGQVPQGFEQLSAEIEKQLEPALAGMDAVLVHNVFTKHFNLPLTAALVRLLDKGKINHCIAWCHDLTWTSEHSRSKVHPGYPWDLLRTYRQDLTYVAVSRQRQGELAGLLGCPIEKIHVIYDGVDPAEIYSLSDEGRALVERLELKGAGLILLMPVRITQAKNIELAMRVLASLKANAASVASTTGGLLPKLVVSGPPDPHDPDDMQYYHSLLELRQQLGIVKEARFVFESGPQEGEGYKIELPLLRELFRVCDALLMPSHREGFGMPILEAGLIKMPVFTTEIPAAEEIGGSEVTSFSEDDPADQVAGLIENWMKTSRAQRLRQRVRSHFTWQAIFENDIQPLLSRGMPM